LVWKTLKIIFILALIIYIPFAKNRFGKWFPVNVEFDDKLGYYYRSGIGNYNNFTPYHICNPFDVEEEEKREIDKIKDVEAIKETFQKLTNETYFRTCIRAMEANTTLGDYIYSLYL